MVEIATWLNLKFGVYQPDVKWTSVPGLYVFAERLTGRQSGHSWRAIYVGKATSFASRIPTHEKWNKAVQLGATHIHALEERQAERREEMEKRLIEHYQPPLNVQHR